MQKKPLVSIIINCFNGDKYLDEAIKSVLAQNYKNWEIIFFDNNSTDNSSSVLKKHKDRRIKYFRSRKTYPLYKARNLAIARSKGEFISFLDVDDWWIKNKLNKQINFFLKNQSIDVLYSNVYLYNDKKKILSTIIKRSIFRQIKFDNRYTIIGDLDFFIRLSLIRSIAAIQEPLAYYRMHDSNLTVKKIDLNIKELENWVSEKVKDKNFKFINFSKIYKLIQTLRIKNNIIEGNRLAALKEMFQKPFNILNFRYIFLLFNFSK